MAAVVGILAALQILGGVLVYVLARSAMHEILAATMFGMGVIAFALGVIIERMDKYAKLKS
ncbi:hypothetical protein ACTDI4_17965 [Mesorhizobium sp. PUT5]|uniref:hypothetical protein n=1 Tax=Mesorhizobium sp. PUT5 TaxID=3454629 RepID=UPI003FA46954